MRTRQIIWLASTALLAGCIAMASLLPALAQPADPEPDANGAEPPAVVGRIAFIQGTVSFRTADQQQWQPATLNYPVTAGDALWTEPQALAALESRPARCG